VSLDPALILAILVGIFHASLYVLLRGSGGGRLPIVIVASILGAWAGDAIGDRLGFEVLTIGDFLDRDRDLVGGRPARPDGPPDMTDVNDDARSTSSFLRGLTVGAILGAIIAGSSLWSRWRRRRTRT
jgi:hypothetical protein